MPTTISTQDTTALLEHLIKFPTVTHDQATNRAALDWVERQLADLPLSIQRLDNHGSPTLVATTPGVTNPKNPKLWLAAHMDVVAAEPEDFKPTIKDGRLYGRGTHDMKFAVAAYIALLKDLGPNLADYDLGLLITSDEEQGGLNGVGWLVNNQGYRGGAVIVPDSSTPWHLETGAKGLVHLDLTAIGHASHASRTWQGVNAIDEIMRFADHIRSRVPAEPCGDPHHNHATASLTTIQGGLSTNQVPASAGATIDIRFPPSTSLDDINAWINEAMTAVPSVSVTIKSCPSYQVVPGEAIDAFQRVATELVGRPLPRHLAHGSSDARYFSWKGVPTINVGVIGSGYHTAPEWVDLADLTRFRELTRRYIDAWAKIEA